MDLGLELELSNLCSVVLCDHATLYEGMRRSTNCGQSTETLKMCGGRAGSPHMTVIKAGKNVASG
jgi:hypothetical protein